MANINLPDRSTLGGIPYQWSQDIVRGPVGWITGDEPDVVTEDLVVATNQVIPARTPLENSAGGLVPASADPTKIVGFSVVDIDTTGAARAAPVYVQGVFNPDLANWPAAYDTAAKKIGAFRGAPAPCSIILRSVRTASVTLP